MDGRPVRYTDRNPYRIEAQRAWEVQKAIRTKRREAAIKEGHRRWLERRARIKRVEGSQ